METWLLLGFRRVTLLLRQFLEALPLAGILPLTGIVGALARGLSFTSIHTFAMYFRLSGGCGRKSADTKHERRGSRQSRSRNRLRIQHGYTPCENTT